MNRVVLMSAGAMLALSIGACDRAATPGGSGSAAAAEASASDSEAVKQAFAAFNAAIVARDLPTIKAQYADDAVMVIPNQPPFVGVDAIMGDYQNYAADPAGKYAPGAETTHVSAGGDLAYGLVNYETTFTNPDTKAVETGRRYNLTVYRKQADGSWKVVQDVNAPLPSEG